MMPAPKWTREDYDRAAEEFERQLGPEYCMEASLGGVQRMITLASLMVIRGLTAGFHVFNELLVQFFSRGRLIQVVPDNMVVRGELEDRPRRSYVADEEPVPFWVLEYVSRGTEQKDYVENRRRYEHELKVPYYLIFDPERKDLTLLRRIKRRYLPVEANGQGRLMLPEIEVEVGLLDGWVRFWFRGELILLPDELHSQVQEERRLRAIAEQTAQQQSMQVEHLDEQIQQRDEQLQQQAAALSAVALSLRPLVEAKARSAGRDDVLAALPAADPIQLTAWLAELS